MNRLIRKTFVRKIKCISTILLLLLLAGCQSLITPNRTTQLHEFRSGNYQIDKTHARVIFKVNHLGLSTYVGRFNDFDASLNFDPNNVSESTLEATIKTASIDLNDESLERTLTNSSWFNSEHYPEVVFTTLSVEPINDSKLLFTGNLTLLGVTKPVVMNITFHGGATNLLTRKYTIGFTAKGVIERSGFGMSSYASIIGDEVEIEVYAEFQRL